VRQGKKKSSADVSSRSVALGSGRVFCRNIQHYLGVRFFPLCLSYWRKSGGDYVGRIRKLQIQPWFPAFSKFYFSFSFSFSFCPRVSHSSELMQTKVTPLLKVA
jgi:hypothetical protein